MKADRIHTDLLSYLKYATLACGYEIKQVLMAGSKSQPHVSTLKEYLLGTWGNFFSAIRNATRSQAKMTGLRTTGEILYKCLLLTSLVFHSYLAQCQLALLPFAWRHTYRRTSMSRSWRREWRGGAIIMTIMGIICLEIITHQTVF